MSVHNSKKEPSTRPLVLWDALIERYYEGATTCEEEREIRGFLFSDSAAFPRYEEHRAVFSYIALNGKYKTEGAFIPRNREARSGKNTPFSFPVLKWGGQLPVWRCYAY